MNLHSQIVAELEALAPVRRQDKATDDAPARMGIKTQTIRNLAKKHAPSFGALHWSDQCRFVQRSQEDGRYEVAHLGVFLMGCTIEQTQVVVLHDLTSLIQRFAGWSVTDAFCIEVLQPLLRRQPTDMLDLMAAWSGAESRWMRRASVVIFTRKIGASGRYTEEGIAACERLIGDADDLVQKGVGWALKDLMRGDRQRVYRYVLELRSRGVPATITLYALKDIQGKERADALAVRPPSDAAR